MRNPWPMFCVLAATGGVCFLFPFHISWLILAAVAVIGILWLLIPLKFNEWLAKKINPYILEYQQDHDFTKLEAGLKKWRRWAITKSSRNNIQINLFCALLEQEQYEEARNTLEQLEARAQTTVDWRNYHLLMAEYAEKRGNKTLAESERQISNQLRTKLETKKNNPKERVTAQQSKQAFFYWFSFTLFLFIGGGVSVCLFPQSILSNLGVTAFILSWFTLPVAAVWLIVWLHQKRKEKSAGC